MREADAVRQFQAAAAASGDFRRYRQPQSRPLFLRTEYAVKRLNRACAFGFGDAWSVVFHADNPFGCGFFGGNVYAAFGRRVAHGIVQQRFGEQVKIGFLPAHGNGAA